ncbi:MAG: hypothetical protein A3F54_02725 [Candidatus Kerfeldbacteria bacterium RIFCSPHIGHO2_12_FULL_48_17]|uniref:3D domain-containing protein n=1 Tax=Candidatus Kerfeldbacteria bacterium RIFCSPHIGHO2_12_FULL_48_17 TaxID=1798542 RepID=A0A1G2B271_9BACT|nr:MAG: hypothetical protein A3F54_02725 [Candidatus Kerfeldbacteria bacterium RIFCSPHIGHO2_12_FULL_48_17]
MIDSIPLLGGTNMPLSMVLGMTLRVLSPQMADTVPTEAIQAQLAPQVQMTEQQREVTAVQYDAADQLGLFASFTDEGILLVDSQATVEAEAELAATAEPQARLPELADKPKKVLRVSVTAYCSLPQYTDSDPFTTASGKRVSEEIVAANFLPFNTKLSLLEIPEFAGKTLVVGDRMAPRFWHKVDVWFPSCEQAKRFGVKYSTIAIHQN